MPLNSSMRRWARGAACCIAGGHLCTLAATQDLWPGPLVHAIAPGSGDSSSAVALVECRTSRSPAEAQLVGVGDRVCGQTVLAIDADGVLLGHPDGGGRQRVQLDGAEALWSGGAPTASSGRAVRLPMPETAVNGADGTVHVTLPQGALDAYLANIPALLSTASVEPHVVATEGRGSRAAGFRIAAVQQGGLVARLGVQPGDVISAVNGRPFTELSAILSLVGDLRAVGHATVGVKRGDNRLTFIVDIK